MHTNDAVRLRQRVSNSGRPRADAGCIQRGELYLRMPQIARTKESARALLTRNIRRSRQVPHGYQCRGAELPPCICNGLVHAGTEVPLAADITTLREPDAQLPGCFLQPIPRDSRAFRGRQVKIGEDDTHYARFRRIAGKLVRHSRARERRGQGQNGRATKLDPRAMRLLMFLADRPGQIVGISELLDGVWGEAVVTPHSVYEAVATLRHALEDPSEKPTYIGTLPRRGYRLIAPVEPPPPQDRVSTASASAVEKAADDEAAAAAPHRRAAVALACAALGLAATFTIAWFTSTRHAPYAAAAVDKSIAVLPFLDMSEKQDQEYFADGMAQEVIDQLVRIPGLKVIGRASSFQFKGKSQDLRTVGSALGVNYVVEGSVRKSGDRLRVTAQLISAQDGSHVWSDTYDEPVGDALNVQDRIAANVVRALQFSVGATEYVAGRVAFKSPEAYELFLKGLHAHERWDKQGLEAAAAYWEKVLELDPTSVPAVEWLAWNHAVEATLVQRNPAEGFELARQLAQRALRLNPKSSLAYQCLAYVHYVYDWDWAAAERDANDAVRLSPSDSGAIGELGDVYRALGRWDESARLYETAISLDPLSSPWHARLRTLLLSTGRLREADAEARKALQISPTSNNGHYMLGSVLLAQGKPEAALAEMQRESGPWRDAGLAMVYYVMGRRAESDAALAKLIQEHGQDGAFVISRAYGYRGGLDQAFTWLERAYHQKDTWLWTIKLDQVDPLLKDFAHDSRFADFLRKMNLPEQ